SSSRSACPTPQRALWYGPFGEPVADPEGDNQMKIDPQRSAAWLDAWIAKEPNPRHRAIAENYKTHLISEVTGDLDRIMATLVNEPVYHFHVPATPMGETGPKNRAEVQAFYEGMFKARVN